MRRRSLLRLKPISGQRYAVCSYGGLLLARLMACPRNLRRRTHQIGQGNARTTLGPTHLERAELMRDRYALVYRGSWSVRNRPHRP